jgi:hypothetical protein
MVVSGMSANAGATSKDPMATNTDPITFFISPPGFTVIFPNTLIILEILFSHQVWLIFTLYLFHPLAKPTLRLTQCENQISRFDATKSFILMSIALISARSVGPTRCRNMECLKAASLRVPHHSDELMPA